MCVCERERERKGERERERKSVCVRERERERKRERDQEKETAARSSIVPVERASTLLSRRDAREFAGTCMCACRVSEYVLTMLDVGRC